MSNDRLTNPRRQGSEDKKHFKIAYVLMWVAIFFIVSAISVGVWAAKVAGEKPKARKDSLPAGVTQHPSARAGEIPKPRNADPSSPQAAEVIPKQMAGTPDPHSIGVKSSSSANPTPDIRETNGGTSDSKAARVVFPNAAQSSPAERDQGSTPSGGRSGSPAPANAQDEGDGGSNSVAFSSALAQFAGTLATLAGAAAALATFFMMRGEIVAQRGVLEQQIQNADTQTALMAHTALVDAANSKIAEAKAIIETLWKGADVPIVRQAVANQSNVFKDLKEQVKRMIPDQAHRASAIEQIEIWEGAVKDRDRAIKKLEAMAPKPARAEQKDGKQQHSK